MSTEHPGLEAAAHDYAADGRINREQAHVFLTMAYPKATSDEITAALQDHGDHCRHPSKQEEKLQRRFEMKRLAARTGAVEQLAYDCGGDREKATMLVEQLERIGLVIELDECRPDMHHHVTPHRGCMLR